MSTRKSAKNKSDQSKAVSKSMAPTVTTTSVTTSVTTSIVSAATQTVTATSNKISTAGISGVQTQTTTQPRKLPTHSSDWRTTFIYIEIIPIETISIPRNIFQTIISRYNFLK